MILKLILATGLLHAFDIPNVENNNEGVKQFSEEKYSESYKNFLKALRVDGTNPLYHFNLGNSFEKSGEVEKALSEYESTANNPRANDELKFNALFNAGNLNVANKNIAKALDYYQKALTIKPDSQEVKTNIELALQQQQGGQGGEGENKDQKQNESDKNKQGKDGKDQDKDKKNDQQNGNDQKRNQPPARPTPRPFQSQALNEGDVRRILEELKRQEEGIRARQDKKENKQNRDENPGKDW